MLAIIIVLAFVAVGQVVVIYLLVINFQKVAAAAQIRMLEALQAKDNDVRALTEAYVRSKGDTVVLRPPAPREVTASWMDKKPPEAFIKSVEKVK